LRTACSCRRTHGAAATEFIAMLALLVPLFLLIPYMGKVADMNHAAVQASRYGAWERVIAPGDAKRADVIGTEVRRRLFSRMRAPIITGQGVVNNERNVLWVDHAGNGMLASYDDVRLAESESDTPGKVAGAVTDAMAGFGQLLEKLPAAVRPSGRFDVNTRGLMRAEVAVNIAGTVVKPLDRGADCDGATNTPTFICTRRHNVILADNWDASSPAQVETRVRAMTIGEIFGEPARLLKAAADQDVPGNPFQDFLGYEPGIVKPDVVPEDRLGPRK
jgi:hypothetical protein